MVKVQENPELIHIAIRNSGCARKEVQPRTYQEQGNPPLTQSSTWMDSLKEMIGVK